MVSCRCIHVGQRGKIVAADVTVKTCVLPVGIVFSLWLQACFLQVWSKKPVGIYAEKVLEVHIFGVLEWARCKFDVVDAEAFHFCRNLRQGRI